MAFEVDEETGNVTMRQGDTGKLVFSGIPTDKDYRVYFSVYKSDRTIVFELNARPIDGQVTFNLSPRNTNKMSVSKGAKYENYYYGVKLCFEEDDYEDTLLVGDKSISELNKMTVYPLIVEGTNNAN